MLKIKKNLILMIGISTLLILGLVFAIVKYTNNTSSDYKLLTNNGWKRDYIVDGNYIDTEFIYLVKNGSFSYYYGVGNAVDDYDLCGSYKFDKEKNIIHLNCDIDEIIDDIEVKSVTKDQLILIFDGEERVFIPNN